MPSSTQPLAGAVVDDAVLRLRPDYRALLIVVRAVLGGPTDEASDAALRRAEEAARSRLAGQPPESLAEVAAWRDAFLGFAVKPRQARSSVEALLRRVDGGLPRINRLTDHYNAISIQHLLPVGGEDLDGYRGSPRLVCATGNEQFDTVLDGEAADVSPEVGEIVWRDDVGVTCRRWNWRQCVRTRLTEDTTNVLFILDALDPMSDDELALAGEELASIVTTGAPNAVVSSRLLPG